MLAEAVLRIVRANLVVGRQQGAQEVGELDVDRRRVVERADRHREQVVGASAALFGDALAVEELSLRCARVSWSRSTMTPMNAPIIAATRISPRRCGSSNSSRLHVGRLQLGPSVAGPGRACWPAPVPTPWPGRTGAIRAAPRRSDRLRDERGIPVVRAVFSRRPDCCDRARLRRPPNREHGEQRDDVGEALVEGGLVGR